MCGEYGESRSGVTIVTFPFNTHPPFEVEIPFVGETDPGTTWAYNVPKVLPAPSAGQRSSYVRALAKVAPDLSTDARWTVGRSISNPEAAVEMLRKGIGVAERCSGDSMLTLLTTSADLASLVVLDQPRGAETPPGIAGPKVRGDLDADGNPLPHLVYEFTSWEACQRYIAYTAEVTLQHGQHLAPSILSSKVSKPVLLAVATIRITGEPEFDQEPEEIHVLVVLDGNTRVINSLLAALGDRFSRNQIAAEIARRMLRKAKASAGGLSAQHYRGRAEAHAEALDRFNRAAGDIENPDLVRFGQTTNIPAEIVIGFHRFGDPLAMREFEFVDAVRSEVGQQHSLAKAWPDGSVTANVGQQAIARAVASGVLSEEIGALAEGSVAYIPAVTLIPAPCTDAGEESGENPEPQSTLDPGLARAVFLLNALTQPEAYEEMKRHIRNLGGHKKVDRNLYGRHIASVLWRGWAPHKEEGHKNETAAWKVGGALVVMPTSEEGDPGGDRERTGESVLGKRWQALFPPRWTDLVPIALDASDPRHTDAKLTLQVAGGLALIADGLLLAASGSTRFGVHGHEYVRRHPATVLALLGKSELGLWTLAHAADSFRSTQAASNSYSINKAIPTGVYAVARPKSAEEPSVAVTTVDGVYQNYDSLRDLAGLRLPEGSNKGKDKPTPKSELEQLEDWASELRSAVDRAVKAQQAMEKLISTGPALAFKAFADIADWESVQKDLMDVYVAVRPWTPGNPVSTVVEDDENFVEDELLDDDDFDDEGDGAVFEEVPA